MKVNLFKKIGAIATSVAMLASLGTTAFAADVSVDATKVSGMIVGTETAAGSGIYKVEIPYTTTEADHKIGVTMLAYADANHENLDPETDTDATSMKIVGVDQINAADLAAADDKFTFFVDTNESANEWNASNETGVIRMNKGEVGVVLLSGDGASAAKGAAFMAVQDSAKAFVNNYITNEDPFGIELTASERPATADAAAIKDAIDDKIAGTVILKGESNDKNTTSIATTNIESVTYVSGDTYNPVNRAQQKAQYDVKVTGTKFTDTTFRVEVTYAANPLTAKSATLEQNTMTVNDTEIGATRTVEWLAGEVKKQLAGRKMILVGADKPDGEYVIAENDANITAITTVGAVAQNAPIGFKVKLAAGTHNGVIVGADGVEAELTVTYTQAQPWEVTGFSVTKDGAPVTKTADIQLTESEEKATKAQVEAAVDAALTGTVATATGADSNSTTEVAAKAKADWTVAGAALAAEYEPGTIKVKVPYTLTTNAATGGADKLFVELDVTIKAAGPSEEKLLGDVDGNDKLQPADWQQLKAYLGNYMNTSGTLYAALFKDDGSGKKDAVVLPSDNILRLAADVDGNGKIQPADWQQLKAYLGKYMNKESQLYKDIEAGKKVTK